MFAVRRQSFPTDHLSNVGTNSRLTIKNYLWLSKEVLSPVSSVIVPPHLSFWGGCLLSVCAFGVPPLITDPSQHVSLTDVTLSPPFSHRHVSMRQSQSSLSLMDETEPYSNILMLTISQAPTAPSPSPSLTHSNPRRLVPAKACPTHVQYRFQLVSLSNVPNFLHSSYSFSHHTTWP